MGCVIQAGMVALEGKRLKCILHIGTNSTDKPTIKVLNYNYIDPQTTIRLSFAAIESLNEALVNTISIGVLIYYTDLGSSTYLYIPTAKVTQPTNNTLWYPDFWYHDGTQNYTNWTSYWAFDNSNSNNYFGNNIVRQPTNFSLGIRAPYYFPTSPTSYASSGNQ